MIWGNEQANIGSSSGGGGGGGVGVGGNGSGGMNAAMQSGNANCFWEDASKAATSTKASVQQNGTGKPLAKSQTVANMQSAAINAKANQNTSKSSTTISKTNSSGNVSSVVNSTSNNNSKKAKGGNSTSKKGKQYLFAFE